MKNRVKRNILISVLAKMFQELVWLSKMKLKNIKQFQKILKTLFNLIALVDKNPYSQNNLLLQ